MPKHARQLAGLRQDEGGADQRGGTAHGVGRVGAAEVRGGSEAVGAHATQPARALGRRRGGGKSSWGDLTVSQKDLAAVGSAAQDLFDDFGQYRDYARVASMTAAGGLKDEGFALGGALDHVAERWGDQVQSLLDACAHISNHLRFTRNQHAADESFIAGTLSSISLLDKGFDHRTGR